MTVEYKPEILKKIIKRCEEVILPVAEAHEKEWEEWEEKAGKEVKALEKQVDIEWLRRNFLILSDDSWESKSEATPVTYKFLWWRWEKNVTKYTQRELTHSEHLQKIVKLLERGLADNYKIVCKADWKGDFKYVRLEDKRGICYKHLGNLNGLSIYIKIKGTIPCPPLPKDKYTNNIAFLKQVKMLVNLPSSESITLSRNQGGELNDLLKTVYELEEENG